MPQETLFQSAEDFYTHLEILNALMDPYLQWAQTKAAKNHMDDFGDEVLLGESYYRRPAVGSFGTHSKMSQRSMERLLYAVVYNNSRVKALAQWIVDAERCQFEKMAESLEQSSSKSGNNDA